LNEPDADEALRLAKSMRRLGSMEDLEKAYVGFLERCVTWVARRKRADGGPSRCVSPAEWARLLSLRWEGPSFFDLAGMVQHGGRRLVKHPANRRPRPAQRSLPAWVGIRHRTSQA